MVYQIKVSTKPTDPNWAGHLLDAIAFFMWFMGLSLWLLIWFIFFALFNDGYLAVWYTLATYLWFSIPFVIFIIGSKDLETRSVYPESG